MDVDLAGPKFWPSKSATPVLGVEDENKNISWDIAKI